MLHNAYEKQSKENRLVDRNRSDDRERVTRDATVTACSDLREPSMLVLESVSLSIGCHRTRGCSSSVSDHCFPEG